MAFGGNLLLFVLMWSRILSINGEKKNIILVDFLKDVLKFPCKISQDNRESRTWVELISHLTKYLSFTQFLLFGCCWKTVSGMKRCFKNQL